MTRLSLTLTALMLAASAGPVLAQASARIFLHPNGCVYTAAGASWYTVVNGADFFPGARSAGCPVTVAPVPGAPSQG